MTAIRSVKKPVVFDEYFTMGFEENASPFLTPSSRRWAKNIDLKSALLSLILFIGALALYFNPITLPLSYLLLVGVYFFAGVPSLIESIEDLSHWEINIDVLMTLAAFSSVLIGSPMEGALLLVLFALSGAMEEAVEAKAKGAINSLYKLTPSVAFVLNDDGTLIERSVKDVKVGTQILIKAGEIVPLDSIVLEGTSSVNLVHLTGENLPVTKKPGDDIPAGARNYEGSLTLQVVRTSSDSSIARIIQLVTQAQETKPKLQRWFDSVSKTYATVVISLSVFFALTLPYILHIPYLGYEDSIYRAIAFLIAASPCALIISTPIAYLSAIGACARKGILLKGGTTLDALANCKAIAFDKTGTLTLGDLRCISVTPLQTTSDAQLQEALGIAASLEKNAVHPISRAVLNYTHALKIKYVSVSDFQSIPGFGLEGIANSHKVYMGKASYIENKLSKDQKVKLDSYSREIVAKGDLLALMVYDKYAYVFHFEDTPRPEIKEIIGHLKSSGLELTMLTGDHAESAQKIAEIVGIDTVYANLTPEDKLKHVENLSKNKGLAMIGDGVNDAPALARATVGICMGKVGSSTAVEAADVVLLHDNLDLIDWLLKKAKKTQRIVKENLTLAFGIILFATIPALLGWIPLWVAVVLHEGGTVMVGLNALRLLKK
jgi:heavy metal translocating P-type ATPase